MYIEYVLNQLTMLSTRTFICYEDNDEYDYYKTIENDSYFQPIQNFRKLGKFNVHGKYASTFHPGKLPNEYYCSNKEAMELRSGRKLNYISNSCFFQDSTEVIQSFNTRLTCLNLKKFIWFLENYHYISSTCYELIALYDVLRRKIREFLCHLEKSKKGIYMKRDFTTKQEEDGEIYYLIDTSEPMQERDTEQKPDTIVFCKCHYTEIIGNKAIEKDGHHTEEFIPKLRNLLKMYSKLHRKTTDSQTFNFVNRRLNEDCGRLIFTFIENQDIKI